MAAYASARLGLRYVRRIAAACKDYVAVMEVDYVIWMSGGVV